MATPLNTHVSRDSRETLDKVEIPTHLHVEDKLLGGFTVRQVLYASVGLSLAYAVWQHLQLLAPLGIAGAALRVTLAALPVILLLACGFAHPTGRPLDEWIFVALRFATLPKTSVWRAGDIHNDAEETVGSDDLADGIAFAQVEASEHDDMPAHPSSRLTAGRARPAAQLHIHVQAAAPRAPEYTLHLRPPADAVFTGRQEGHE